MTNVDTATRNGIGVSFRLCPVLATTNAAQAPTASGSSNAHRFLRIIPATRATTKMRIMVTSACYACFIGFVHAPITL